MLKSLVPVFLSSLMLFVSHSAIADSGHSSVLAPKVVSSRATTTNFNVSFVQPGRQMRQFVDKYVRDNDEALSMVRDRSKRPFTIIDSVMEQYDLPVELKYLAVIESELRATALSHVGARGPWQLMAGTARDLGLKVNGRSDERTNYYKSTRAAALYLRDLHREFGDWLLVLAAYNAGPVPVCRAIQRAHSRNFWALERYLPAESRQHVKRFLATAYYFKVNAQMEDLVPVQPTAVCVDEHTEFPGESVYLDGMTGGVDGQGLADGSTGADGQGLADGSTGSDGQGGADEEMMPAGEVTSFRPQALNGVHQRRLYCLEADGQYGYGERDER